MNIFINVYFYLFFIKYILYHTSCEIGRGVKVVEGKAALPECSINFVTDFSRLLALSSNCFL